MRKKNYRVFVLANLIISFSAGLLGPFYIVFIERFAGMESFGAAIGIMVIASSLTSYFAGKYSDKFGRKIFLVATSFVGSFIIFAYTLISNVFQLFILQALSGINNSIYQTTSIAFLGDVTIKQSRGKDVGKYNAVVGVVEGIAMFLAGFLVAKIGFKVIFYVTALLSFISSFIFLKIEE